MKAIERAVDHVGGQTNLAKLLKTSQARVWNWIHRDNKVPAEEAVSIERVTKGKVTRFEIRPDVFGEPPKNAA